MSTNATINIQHEDGTYSQTYLHWDGHIDTAGKCLLANYNTQEKVEELVALGDLSQLDANIGSKTDFATPAKGQCVAYGRDRNEDDTDALKFDTFDKLCDDGRIEEYNYIFIDGAWEVQEFQLTEHCRLTLATHQEVI